MSLADSSALWTNRLQALAPQISTLGYSQAYNFGISILSAFEDANYLQNQGTVNLSVLTAFGIALDLLGANAGIWRLPGTCTGLLVQFSVQTAVIGVALTIQAGQLVATVGDNITVIQQTFVTQAAATISVGQTTSTIVLAINQLPGTAGNVAAGSITLMQTAQSGVSVTNNPGTYTVPTSYTSVDAYGQILGTDTELDGPFRSRILAALALKYSTYAQNLAMQAVNMPEQLSALGDTAKHNYQPWTTYVYDPQNGSGFIYYSWALVDGTCPGLPAGATTAVADGCTYVVLGATVLSDYALAVDIAIKAVSPGNTVARIFAAGSVTQPMNTVNVTTLVAKFTASPSVVINTSTFTDPSSTVVKQATIAYIQALVIGQAPTVIGASQFVMAYCADQAVPLLSYVLTGVNGTNPVTTSLTAGSATNPTLYRCTAATSAVTLSIGSL